jgi:putative endonuclease
LAYVYMVKCRDGTLYTGYAEDVLARVARHNDGAGAKYTRGRLPVVLVYAQWASDRAQAQRLEARIKSLDRAQKKALCRAWLDAGGVVPTGE